MSRLDLVAMAHETMRFTEEFIRETGNDACAEVEVYSPERLQDIEDDVDEFFERAFYGTNGATYYVCNADSFEAAKSLERPLVMNFANAHRPGGGFLNGARAQEESLCRCSTLYKSISCEKAEEMYHYNNIHREPCSSDYMLISPNVYVYRDFTGEILDFPFWTSVVTVPAPNRNGEASGVPQDILDKVMVERLRKMLFLAARRGYRNLVLGAWGCGAFGNDTRRVAEYFYNLFFGMDRFDEFFDNVVFAILGDEEKIDIFKEVFSDKVVVEKEYEESSEYFAGYYTTRYDYPVCNHSEDIGEENIGYASGITADGMPFEAELFEIEGTVGMAIIMPAIFDDAYEDTEEEEVSKENIAGIHYEVDTPYCSVLDIGMVDVCMEENDEVVKDYVDFLTKNGIVTFASNLLNGSVFYRVDMLGNNLAQVIITMSEGDNCWAYTDIEFKEFPGKYKDKKSIFRVVEDK